MDKTKIIPIMLLVVILGVGFVAFTFYTQKEDLLIVKQALEEEKEGLAEENKNLHYKYNGLNKEKGDIERKLAMVEEKLSEVEAQRENWRKKWSVVSEERNLLIEKVKRASGSLVKRMKSTEAGTEKISEDYWAGFVKDKAALEAKLNILNKTLFNEKLKMAKLDTKNKELSIEMGQLAKEKKKFLEEIKFKERTLRIISLDLVNEREARGGVINEVKKLRRENVNLKRELIVANRELIKLQDTFKAVADRKEILEDKIADADSILQEKSLAFEELQAQLVEVIKEGKKLGPKESASIELPPIIVKPAAPGLKELRGEIIAVNHEEKFVVVDIGESSGLRPGILLKIMRGDKEIGTAEVIETRKEISAADIKRVISGCIIQEGDITITR